MGKIEKVMELTKQLEIAENQAKLIRLEIEGLMGIKTHEIKQVKKERKPWGYYSRGIKKRIKNHKLSKGIAAYWAKMTPEEKTAEMRRRIQVAAAKLGGQQ